ncbi:MAG TPA: hypothetical protein VKC63_02470 [Solirubrobacterales bacterium]|nr:hypothetical protein [Solirubrobacterales bacterium]
MLDVREAWTDWRLDDFARNVDTRFDRLESKVEDGFRELRQEMSAMQRLMIQFAAVMIAALVGLLATQLGPILTQI